VQRSPKHVNVVDDATELVQHVAIDSVVEHTELAVVFVDGFVGTIELVAVIEHAVDPAVERFELRSVFVRQLEYAAELGQGQGKGQEQVIVGSSLDRSSTIPHRLLAKIRCVVAVYHGGQVARSRRRDSAYLNPAFGTNRVARAGPLARRNRRSSSASARNSRRRTKKKTSRFRDVEGPSLETRVGSLALHRLAESGCLPLCSPRKPQN
jgi:hypothetical protein